MALSCASMIANIQAFVGRPNNEDTVLVSTCKCWQWINEAQREIVRYCHDIPNLKFKNTVSIDFTDEKVSYPLSDITPNSDVTQPEYNGIAYVNAVYLIDGANSEELDYVPLDEFAEIHSDPTHADSPTGKPKWWTRRGNNIEVTPMATSDYDGKDMRIDGVRWATDFTVPEATRCSDISSADNGLIYYAVAEAWAAIGDDVKWNIWRKKFSNPNPSFGDDYGWLQRFSDSIVQMDSWGSTLFPEM